MCVDIYRIYLEYAEHDADIVISRVIVNDSIVVQMDFAGEEFRSVNCLSNKKRTIKLSRH